jgi:hypothetical protein
VVELADLREQTYKPSGGVSVAACLAVADGLNFAVGGELADGECSAGLLSLDSISFR